MVLGGVALVFVLWRVWSARRSGKDPQTRALLALEYELFTLVRRGRAPLEAHAADWRGSPIFSRYPTLASDDVVRTYLVDAVLLLVDDPTPEDLDQLLGAMLRIARRKAPTDRRAARQQLRLLECIRRSVVTMRRGASPVTAVRSGRSALSTDDRPSTQDITSALIGLSGRIRRVDKAPDKAPAGGLSPEEAREAVRRLDLAASARDKPRK